MHLESPAFTRCCFCVPLRRGLIGWGYVRLAVGVFALLHSILFSFFLLSDDPRTTHILLAILACSPCLLDVAFNLTLIVASHKKSAKLLSISFILGVMWFLMFLAVSSYIIYYEIASFRYWYHHQRHSVHSPLATAALIFAITFVHWYMMLMIRSEVKKLQTQSMEMKFVNNAADGEAVCIYEHRRMDDQHDAVTYKNYEQDV